MEYIFFGNHSSLPGRLERALSQHVVECPTLTQFCQAMIHVNPVNFCVFLEKDDVKEDLDTIQKLRQLYSAAYIILFANSLDKEEKIAYIKVGVNCVITESITKEELLRLLAIAEDFLCKKTICNKKDKEPDRLYSFHLPLWKRAFDIAASLGAILCLSPIFVITAVAIELESKGPIVYKSKRVGSNYKIFDFYKFRSMYPDADKRLAEYKAQNQYNVEVEGLINPSTSAALQNPLVNDRSTGSLLYSDNFSTTEHDYLKNKSTERANTFFKMENDPRVTRVGRILRKYSIDELPQLFNILKGDMSVVGNRPLPIYEAEQLTSDNYIERFMAPSGLTGLWQVEKRGNGGNLSPEERKQLDIKYARTFSFGLDMKIIFRTFTAFIQEENV
ncbi:sugar transferase [Parabacteroides hominis]|uniref:Sugar transferase n=1 Tax=Parabacteroides hominis TaxID=2763057 RepID=A0ABR7DLD5_9BACT|nr:sugar transferase [Parabacteroides hominis]MBC5632220.1 sugar transferase [Parabacteroides hominis]